LEEAEEAEEAEDKRTAAAQAVLSHTWRDEARGYSMADDLGLLPN
jgi:hypothetical protein